MFILLRYGPGSSRSSQGSGSGSGFSQYLRIGFGSGFSIVFRIQTRLGNSLQNLTTKVLSYMQPVFLIRIGIVLALVDPDPGARKIDQFNN
jgi:hypothetical protein